MNHWRTAPQKKKEEQIMIDTQGKPIEKEIPSLALLTTTTLMLTIDGSSSCNVPPK
jgi:hypothetical protein